MITSPALTESGTALLATVRQVSQVWGLCAEVMAAQAREATAIGRLMTAAWTTPTPHPPTVATAPVESVQPIADEHDPVVAENDADEDDADEDGVLLEVLIKRLLEADLLVSR